VKDVIIIGGGLAGLTNAILLNRAGLSVQLFEEKKYPFHRVCGEYISNEVIPFLKQHDLFPEELEPSTISQFHLTSVSGNSLKMCLDLGGFGISRYAFDQWLLKKAIAEGVQFVNDRITNVKFNNDGFVLTDKKENYHESKVVIGAFGKRSLIDKELQRDFLKRRSPFIGVKYHVRTDEVSNQAIELHNFKNGYCGISRIENGVFNMCYLSHRSNLKASGSVQEMEEQILMKNPHLKCIISNSEILFERPEVINEITFEKKEPVHNHVLMSGDSAGMITPLCGNGMAMAIHSAKILSEILVESFRNGFDRMEIEKAYIKEWNGIFARRLWAGRKIQKLFGSPMISEAAVSLGKWIPPFSSYLMKQTHGEPFN
jgi:flavin-dependent dehydrogenase